MEHIGSYPKEDVTFLLKELGDSVQEVDTKEREKLNQSGVHYSEMLPLEYEPTAEYITLFRNALAQSSERMAEITATLAERIRKSVPVKPVLVSLARAGTPAGILVKRYIRKKYNEEWAHYSVSIIRGKGIDYNALDYIIKEHGAEGIIFVDGWTGKGAITKELAEACEVYSAKKNITLKPHFAVLADPGYSANIVGPFDDFLIPSACLNATVSGLVSRTFHRADIISETDFHGVKFYREKKESDFSNIFVDAVSNHFSTLEQKNDLDESYIAKPQWLGVASVERIQKEFGVENIHFVKPGVGETTRVLLRRVPWKILVHPEAGNDVTHILQLAKERNIPVEEYANMSYSCCGIIKAQHGSAE